MAPIGRKESFRTSSSIPSASDFVLQHACPRRSRRAASVVVSFTGKADHSVGDHSPCSMSTCCMVSCHHPHHAIKSCDRHICNAKRSRSASMPRDADKVSSDPRHGPTARTTHPKKSVSLTSRLGLPLCSFGVEKWSEGGGQRATHLWCPEPTGPVKWET